MVQPTKDPLFTLGKVYSESSELSPEQTLAKRVGELLIRSSSANGDVFRSAIAVAMLDISRLYKALHDEEIIRVKTKSYRVPIVELSDSDAKR